VTVAILQHLGLGQGSYRFSQLLPRAQQTFWQTVLPEVCNAALERTVLARQEFEASGLFGVLRNSGFAGLIAYIEGSMNEALVLRRQSQEFLSAFK
jgi:hypothetical protein